MKFWDASALVPLLTPQPATHAMRGLHRADPRIAAWWATEVECASAVARLSRERIIDAVETTALLEQLALHAVGWREIHPTAAIRTAALRLLRTHALRAGDAIQLASALAACDGIPSRLPFVCLDDRLRAAAEKEGFKVLP